MEPANKGKLVIRMGAGIIMAVAVTAGSMHFLANMAYESTDDAYVSARVHAIASKVGGNIQKVFVTDDQAVKKGDMLAQIDPADYELKVKEASTALSAEEARLLDAQARIRGAQASLAVAAATLKQATLDKNRAERLFKQGVLPKEKLEKAQTALDLAMAQGSAAEEGVTQAQALRHLEEALIASRRAALEAANLNLGYTTIMAPEDGFVTKKSVEDGNIIQPGQPLMAVVALEDTWVLANYKETQLEHVRPGQAVVIKVDTYPGHTFHGKVKSIMAGTGAAFSMFPPENALGNYVKIVQRVPVKIVLDKDEDPGHLLRLGMSVVAKIRVRE